MKYSRQNDSDGGEVGLSTQNVFEIKRVHPDTEPLCTACC